MSVGYYLIIIGAIIILWGIAGCYEWNLPYSLAKKVIGLGYLREEQDIREAFILNFEAREFPSDDIEKEIYIIRKSRRGKTSGSIVMNVGVEPPEHIFDEKEREKAKLRLERRFPGLTVNFTKKEQEENDAGLCSD